MAQSRFHVILSAVALASFVWKLPCRKSAYFIGLTFINSFGINVN